MSGNEWISVKERLPARRVSDHPFATGSGIVLVWTPEWAHRIQFGEWFEELGQWSINGGSYDVTHWMPLPDPPEETK